MRNIFIVSIVMGSVGFAPAPLPSPVTFRVSDAKNGADRIRADAVGGKAVIRVECARGIGSCTVTPTKGKWPKNVTLILEGLNELEHFEFTTARMQYQGGRKSSGRFERFILGKGGEERSPAGTSDVRVERRKEGMAVVFPAGTFAGADPAGFQWVLYLLR